MNPTGAQHGGKLAAQLEQAIGSIHKKLRLSQQDVWSGPGLARPWKAANPIGLRRREICRKALALAKERRAHYVLARISS